MNTNNIEGKWLCALHADVERWNSPIFYDTKEEAIECSLDAIKRYNKDPENESLEDELGYFPDDTSKIKSFAVGKCNIPPLNIGVDTLLERKAEDMWDYVGELAEDYLNDVTEEHEKELEGLIYDWFVRHDYLPKFYMISEIEEIRVEESK